MPPDRPPSPWPLPPLPRRERGLSRCRTAPDAGEDARGIRFSGTRLRSGYAQEEVDGFLDRAEATLAALSAGRSEADPLTAAQVEAARFSVTRLQPGYDASEVDEFLDALAAELRRHGLD